MFSQAHADVGMPEEDTLPPLRDDLKLLPSNRTPDGSPTWLLHDPACNRFFHIGWQEFEILSRWGLKSATVILQSIAVETTLNPSAASIGQVKDFLVANHLIRIVNREATFSLIARVNGAKQSIGKLMLHHYLFFRIPLIRPDRFLTKTLPYIHFVFSRYFIFGIVLSTLLGLFLVSRQWDSFISTTDYFFSLQGIVVFGFSLLFTKSIHELGHAYTTKYYGGKVPSMGIAFLVMWPVLYTDTSDAWKLTSKRQRLIIGGAGMMAELALAGFATLVWSFLPEGAGKSAAFFIATVSWVTTLAINTNPFMRWDGYYLLSDYLGIPNLQHRAFAIARWRLREFLFCFGDQPPEIFTVKIQRIVLLYAYATWLYRLVLFLSIALMVYYLFFKLLGIFLLIVELSWFVALPIHSEMKVWWQRKNEMHWDKYGIRNILIIIVLIVVLVVPWSTSVIVPAVLSSESHATIYSPFPAQISEVKINIGDNITKGQTLFLLDAPDLQYRKTQAEQHIHVLRNQLLRESANEILIEHRLVQQQELAEAMVELEGYQKQQEQLIVHSPIVGEVVQVTDNLSKGRWIDEKLQLTHIINPLSERITGYITEGNLKRISVGTTGKFYPDNSLLSPFIVQVYEIDLSNTEVLDKTYLASIFGGDIAVSQGENGEIIPNQTIYRLKAKLLSADSTIPTQVLRGTLRLEGATQSLIAELWRSISAVLVRESGF